MDQQQRFRQHDSFGYLSDRFTRLRADGAVEIGPAVHAFWEGEEKLLQTRSPERATNDAGRVEIIHPLVRHSAGPGRPVEAEGLPQLRAQQESK